MAPKLSKPMKKSAIVKVMRKPAVAALKRPSAKAAGPDDDVMSQLSCAPTLNKKLDIIKSSPLSDGEKIHLLKCQLDSDDWTKLNMKANYAGQNDADLKKDLDDALGRSRAEKRDVVCAWVLDPSRGSVYKKMKMGVDQTQTWKKKERWQGKSAFVPSKWTQEEFDQLIHIGRIDWREVAGSSGVYEYYDKGDMVMTQQIAKYKKSLGQQNENVEAGTDHAEGFMASMASVDGFGGLQAIGGPIWSQGSKGKGKGKGATALAIEDGSAGGAGAGGAGSPGDGAGNKGRRGGSKALTDEQKQDRAKKSLASKVQKTITQVDAAMWNNGRKLKKKRSDVLVDAKVKLQQVLKTDLGENKDTALHQIAAAQKALKG